MGADFVASQYVYSGPATAIILRSNITLSPGTEAADLAPSQQQQRLHTSTTAPKKHFCPSVGHF